MSISSLIDLDIRDRARTEWKSRRREAWGGDGWGVPREQETLGGKGAVSCLAAWSVNAEPSLLFLWWLALMSFAVPVTLELVFNLYMHMTCAAC